MEYISTKEASAKWGISTIRITVLANEGRIPGAQRLGRSWLIPASATKPEEIKPNRSGVTRKKPKDFSFPLYHFRPDWNHIKKELLSEQEQMLLQAETAVLECRFAAAYPILESVLLDPEDVAIEVGCLWNAGICYIALNRPEDFSKVYVRLQLLLAGDFPHRDDFTIVLDALNTYVETIGSSSKYKTFNTSIHDQVIPLTCLQIGYAYLTKEAMKSGSADTALLEINLRFLTSTSAVVAIEMMHIYLLGIYCLRQDLTSAEKHAQVAVQLAYENKYYFPLVTFYRYFAPVLSTIIAQYPEEFQSHCNELISQYVENTTAFFSSADENSTISTLSEADYPYIYAILNNSPIPAIAGKLGISNATVKRKLTELYEKVGVRNKAEMRDYLRKYM